MSTTGANQKAIISKILVAIDGSDESMDAADLATSISKEYNAELYALHVIRADVDLFGPQETSEFMTKMRNEGEKYLDKVKLKANEKNVQIKTEIISSMNISGGILDYAEENNFDLIVIGTRGRSGFKRLLLGSVASHVITYAHCPVLVVK
jgi:nucleotide-binding universal stress UspA family protein